MQRQQFPYQEPHSFLLVGYQSWVCMWIELDDDEQHGGTLFEGALDYDRFYRRHNQLTHWLEHVTSLVEAGRGERREGPNGLSLLVPDPHDDLPRRNAPARHRTPCTGSRSSSALHAELADALAARIGHRSRRGRPRGATHTIADVLASDSRREFRATIAGRVIGSRRLLRRHARTRHRRHRPNRHRLPWRDHAIRHRDHPTLRVRHHPRGRRTSAARRRRRRPRLKRQSRQTPRARATRELWRTRRSHRHRCPSPSQAAPAQESAGRLKFRQAFPTR